MPGVRCQCGEVRIPGPDCQKRRTTFCAWLLTPDSCNLQVHPAMLMKTQQGQEEGAGCQVSGASPARCASRVPIARSGERHSDSWLLTPDYRNLQVHPAMLMKTKQGQ